jgi:hypothetical protein
MTAPIPSSLQKMQDEYYTAISGRDSELCEFSPQKEKARLSGLLSRDDNKSLDGNSFGLRDALGIQHRSNGMKNRCNAHYGQHSFFADAFVAHNFVV